MLITKAINNNVVLAEDEYGRELVLFGKGLGFRGAPAYIDDEEAIQRRFYNVSHEFYDAISSLSDEVIIISSGIVDIARQELNCELNPNLAFTLADHIQFAIDRTKQGMAVKNPLYEEVRFVYPREAEVGRRGVLLTRSVAEVDIPDFEAASIALHIVNAESVEGGQNALNSNMDLIVRSTEVLDAVSEIIERKLDVKLDRAGYDYARFVTHMRFLVSRLMEGNPVETRNGSLFKQAARDFSEAYSAASAIDECLRSKYDWECSDEELLYLMMHINRLVPERGK